MKKETRNVVVLDLEDKIKLQQSIRDLEEVAETYQRPCKELTGINNILYYLKTIEEKIDQRMKIRLAKKIMKHKCTFLDLEEEYKKKGYNVKWLLAWASYDKRKMCRNALPFDHRITKAISLTSKKK